MPTIHPTAIVAPEVVLASDVQIGPFCIVSGKVTLGAGVQLLSHVNISGPVEIGAGTMVYPGAAIGFPGQDFKFKIGMPTAGVKIGAGCLLREHITIHAATKEQGATTLGDRVFMMVNSHVGHDCRIGDDVILVNNVACGGHSEVHQKAIISGGTVVHQFNRVGKFAMVSGGSAFSQDVPPFCIGWGRNTLRGVNVVGMRRNGYSASDINAVREAFRELLRSGMPKAELIEKLRQDGRNHTPLLDLADFIETSKRGVAAPPRGRDSDGEMVE